jgi:hypothetical protein
VRPTHVKHASRLWFIGAVALLLGCSDDGSSVEVLAEAPANPGTDVQPDAALASSDAELADTWVRYGFGGSPTSP